MRIWFSALALSTAALVTACEADPTGSSNPSHFAATIEGSISASYEGTGHFSTTTQRRPAAPPVFFLHSRGAGEARNQGFEFSRRGAELPAVGTYTLGRQSGDLAEFNAAYSHQQGNVTYRYAAQSGELHITTSTPQRIAGTFRFSGVFAGTCTSSRGSVTCTVNPTPDPDAAAVEVSGSFEVVPARF